MSNQKTSVTPSVITHAQLERLRSFGSSDLIPTSSPDSTPRYLWRGFMLDSARTFWPVETVCEVLALMARYRLNKLHWHLCDDAGWRFEVTEYPRLTTTGATLPREEFFWYTNVDLNKAIDAHAHAPKNSTTGYYRDEEIAYIVDFAASLGIDIIPEIDLPGHMGAAIRAYPELGDPRLSNLSPHNWSHRNDVLWPGSASTRFIQTVLNKVTSLFPSQIVHIGGDEVNLSAWESDTDLMKQAAVRGINNGAQLQSEFILQARKYLARRGRRIAVWDDALVGHADALSGEEIVTAWQEDGGVERAKMSARDWVFADSSLLYLNRVAGPVDSEPAGMFGAISTGDILEAVLPHSEKLLGIQAALWCEFISNRDVLYHYLFPRLLAVSQIAWTAEKVSWEDFAPHLEKEMLWLAEHDIIGRPLDEHTFKVHDPIERPYEDLPIDRHQAPEALRATSSQ